MAAEIPFRRLPEALITIGKTYGGRGLALRSMHEARRALGLFKVASSSLPTHRGGPLHSLQLDREKLGSGPREAAIECAEFVAAGCYRAFGMNRRQLPSTAAEWLTHPVTGFRHRSDIHWSKIDLRDSAAGDIKDVWDPARFGWLYPLVASYILTGDRRYTRVFERHFEGWCRSSPPFRGPHWACGQEAAIRTVALLYAEANFYAAGTSPTALEEMLWASGQRIDDAFGYALSQRNNHAISEAVGLLLLGLRFQGCDPRADRWRERGLRWIPKLVREQFADDGWYAQHSFYYARVALDMLLVAKKVANEENRLFPPAVRSRLHATYRLLCMIVNPDGTAPNYGANDGSLVHPLSCTAEYRDFRPLLSAVAAAFEWEYPECLQVDCGAVAWLGCSPPRQQANRHSGVTLGPSGWAVVKTARSKVFFRAGRYRNRPGHIDPLQVDISFDGREVVVDPGSYSYNQPPPWRNGLSGHRCHNGPVLPGETVGVRGPRAVWLVWPRADLQRIHDHFAAHFIGTIPGYARRSVVVEGAHVLIVDEVLSTKATEAELNWLLHPAIPQSTVHVDGLEVVEAAPDSTAGWFSPTYGRKEAGVLLRFRSNAKAGTRIATHFVGGSQGGISVGCAVIGLSKEDILCRFTEAAESGRLISSSRPLC